MTDTTLDAAIAYATRGLPNNGFQELVTNPQRKFACALITHLFANLEPPEGATCYEVDLFNDAKRALLKAAGLEDLA